MILIHAVLLATTALGPSQAPPIRVTLPDEVPGVYEELSAKWWIWALTPPSGGERPADSKVLADATGSMCALGQPEDRIWFLAGTFPGAGFVERHCDIPADRKLFFPLINAHTGAPYRGETLEDLRQQIGSFFDGNYQPGHASTTLTIGATINGVALSELVDAEPSEDALLSLRTKSKPFSLGSRLLVDLHAGMSQTQRLSGKFETTMPDLHVGDGYYVLLEPLPPGQHTITIKSSLTFEDWAYVQDIVYRLNVASH